MAMDSSDPILWPEDEPRWSVTFEWGVIHGRAAPTAIHVESIDHDEAVTATLMRELPIAGLASEASTKRADRAASKAKAAADRRGRTQSKAMRAVLEFAEQLAHNEEEMFRGGPRRGRPPKSLDELVEVARTYIAALETRQPPTKAVQKRFQVSHGTAGKWVARCREIGLLGPAPGRGIAGTVEPEEET